MYKNVQPGIKIILNVVLGNKMLNLSQDHAKNNNESWEFPKQIGEKIIRYGVKC